MGADKEIVKRKQRAREKARYLVEKIAKSYSIVLRPDFQSCYAPTIPIGCSWSCALLSTSETNALGARFLKPFSTLS